MSTNSTLNHIKNIFLLPVNVTVVIPYVLFQYVSNENIIEDNSWILVLGALLVIAGLLLFSYTVFLFKRKGEGTLAPWDPTNKLVVEGPYRHTRNPMIMGVLTILLGEALFVNALVILLWAVFFFIMNTIYFQFIEEPKLEQKFGESYLHYKNNVPRWIPKRKPYKQD